MRHLSLPRALRRRLAARRLCAPDAAAFPNSDFSTKIVMRTPPPSYRIVLSYHVILDERPNSASEKVVSEPRKSFAPNRKTAQKNAFPDGTRSALCDGRPAAGQR